MKKITIDPDIITVDEVDFDSIVAFRDINGDIYVMIKTILKNGANFLFVCITSKTVALCYSAPCFRESIEKASSNQDVLSFKDQFEFAEWILSFKTRLHGIDTNVKS